MMNRYTKPRQMVRSMGGHSSKENWEERRKVLDGFHSPRVATDALVRIENLHRNIWEPANGFSRITTPLRSYNHSVFTSDVHRWCRDTDAIRDFRTCTVLPLPFRKEGCDIVTNPPYVLAQEFADTALRLLPRGRKCCMLLRLQFLEGNKRHSFFMQRTLRRVHIFSFRIPRMHRFLYEGPKGGNAIAFAWFVWQAGYCGPTELRWIGRDVVGDA